MSVCQCVGDERSVAARRCGGHGVSFARVVGWLGLVLGTVVGGMACGPVAPAAPDVPTVAADTTSEVDAGREDVGGDAEADAAVLQDATDPQGDSAGGGGDVSAPVDTTSDDVQSTICAPNGHHCDGQKIYDCKPDGTPGALYKTCKAAEICAPLKSDKDLRGCFPKVCDKGTTVCSGKSVKACNAWGTSFVFQDCKSFLCTDGKCSTELKCQANTKRCEGEKILACSADGKEETNAENCGGGTACVADAKAGTAVCAKKVCAPSLPACLGETLTSCNGNGTKVLPGGTDCTKTKESCLVVKGIATCAPPSCGDGKVNGPTDDPKKAEDCDLGDANGKPGVLCSTSCKKLDDSCLTVADCKDLSLPVCSLSWACVAGKCRAQAAISATCDDGNPCTEADRCAGGSCVGLPKDCDDGNPCTKTSCEPKVKGGCVTEQLSNEPCDDGNICTVGDACIAGFCKSGGQVCQCTTTKDCAGFEDGNPCTGSLKCVSGACEVWGWDLSRQS